MLRQLARLSSLINGSVKTPLLLNSVINKFKSAAIPRNFSILSNVANPSILPSNNLNNFLQPAVVALNFDRGFKVKGRLRRRCKDCYFVMRQERLYVICKTHPRHKQMSMIKKPHNTWILSHASQSPMRPW